MNCRFCLNPCIKKGIRATKQRWLCKNCHKYQLEQYQYHFISEQESQLIQNLHKEGMSISSMARIVQQAKSSVQRCLEKLSRNLSKPIHSEEQQDYEVDELHTYTRSKRNECWIIYAINKATRTVIDFVCGRRSKENLRSLIHALLRLNPRSICTDQLNIYPTLVPAALHKTGVHKTNHIERMNLELRKNLKCLNRKTICYSKSEKLLQAKLGIYFFS